MNEKIETALTQYFVLCESLNVLLQEKEQLRSQIQTEMRLNDMQSYTTDSGWAKFKVASRETINKTMLKKLVAPDVVAKVTEVKKVESFEIRSAESIGKMKEFNGGKK